MVDLLGQHHEQGRRFQPSEFIEKGRRVAVGMTVTDARWGEESAEAFKVFTFAQSGDHAVLLQDCAGRDDALSYLDGQ